MGTALKQLRFYEVEIRELEPRIIEIDYGTQIITAELLEAVVEKVHKEWPDYKVAILVQAASAVDLGRVAKVVEAEKLGRTTAAVAILGHSKLAQMLGNLFMRYERSPYPNRLFTDREAAIAWLRARLKEE
jgi:hypothetical protein